MKIWVRPYRKQLDAGCRGGSGGTNSAVCRSSKHVQGSPTFRHIYDGFRLVLIKTRSKKPP